ncbi:MAG TPA: hypothetical protein VFF17_15865 [Thermoanaerobaculia bacterium]|nr:hypothetical protein [Thermoanaerobaculia bacterium]
MKRARIAGIVAGLALAASPVASAAPPREVLPWVEDFAKAASQARAKNVPIFLEAWAPW